MNLAVRDRAATSAAVATLAVAAIGWLVAVTRMNAMPNGSGIGVGLLSSFIGLWVVMMAAMMLPSAVPLITGFVSTNQNHRGWPAAATLLAASYILSWTAFGVAGYFVLSAIEAVRPQSMSWVIFAGAAIALAGLYSFTPLQRGCMARCRALCERPALKTGFVYGINCIGCSAGLMIALLVIGVSSIAWMVIVSSIVFMYKVVPMSGRLENTIAIGLVAVGVWVAIGPSTVPGFLLPQ